jgi:hypothetical protein
MADTTGSAGPDTTSSGSSSTGSSSTGNFWTRKVGPIPLWLWGILVLALVVFYKQWAANKAASTQSNTASTTSTSAANQTPPFIIQNYPASSWGGGGTTATAGGLPTATQQYTVTGTTTPSDQYPQGVAVAAYQLKTTDPQVAYYAALITLENPGISSPYPVGTVLNIPVNQNLPATPQGATSTTLPLNSIYWSFPIKGGKFTPGVPTNPTTATEYQSQSANARTSTNTTALY